MLSFIELKRNRTILVEGGNTVVLNDQGKRTSIAAEKIVFSDALKQDEFSAVVKSSLKALNILFGKWINAATAKPEYSRIAEIISKYNIHAIWPREDILDSGYAFNGSSEFLMSKLDINDAQALAAKKSFGDIDVTVPGIVFIPLFVFLYDLQFNPSFVSSDLHNEKVNITGKESSSGTKIYKSGSYEVFYCGHNKNKVKKEEGGSRSTYERVLVDPNELNSLQINSVFILKKSEPDIVLHFQVDFEKTEYQRNVKNFRGGSDTFEYGPSEQSKFGHSSSLEDISSGLKGAFHKFSLMALAKIMTEIESAVKVNSRGFSAEGGEKFFKLGMSTGVFSVDKGFRKKYKMASQPKEIEEIQKKLEEKLKQNSLEELNKIQFNGTKENFPRRGSKEYKLLVLILGGYKDELDEKNTDKISKIVDDYNNDLKELRDKLDKVKTQLQEIPSTGLTTEDYITTIKDLYKALFKKDLVDKSERKDMLSFLGILRIVKKNLNEKRIIKFFDYILNNNTWTKQAQRLERNNPKEDYDIKNKLVDTLIEKLGKLNDTNLSDKKDEFMSKVKVGDYVYSGRKSYHVHPDLQDELEIDEFNVVYKEDTLRHVASLLKEIKNIAKVKKYLLSEYKRGKSKELIFFINQLHYYSTLPEQKKFFEETCLDKNRLLCYYLIYAFVSPEDDDDEEHEE